MKRFRQLGSRGDTIIEVLIVLAVLGLALTMSYATANRGLQQSRNADEHSQALGTLTSQVELVRKAVSDETNVFITGQPFCMKPDGTPVTGFSSGAGVADPKTDNLAGYPAACHSGNFYNESITYDNATGTFTFRVHWDGQGNLGSQQELMTYRIHALTPTGSSGVPLSSSPARILVVVESIKQTNINVAPTCSTPSPTIGTPSGESSIKLQQQNGGGGAQDQTTTNSVAIYDSSNGVVEGGTYKAHMNSAPAGFTPCAVESGQVTAAGGTDTTIKMRVAPVCHLATAVGPPYVHYSWQNVFIGFYSDTPVYAHYSTAKNHVGPDWGPFGPATPSKGPPNPRYGIPTTTPVLQQWETSHWGYGPVIAEYDQYSPGSTWFNRFEWIPYVVGWWSDTPAYNHFQWQWLPTPPGVPYGDPYTYQSCPT
jgi:prepilin-type N-terminal cleavage/methylation domain-containing protein